jgi:UDP-glucuronate 4-epimerase
VSAPTPASVRGGGRIAVTGAAGFVGSHLVERLIAEGHDVVGIDCFSTNYSRERKERNLAPLAGEPRFELVEDDMCAPSVVRALRGCQAVIHMAALPGVRSPDERGLWRVNVRGTARLLDIIREAGVPRVILASSSSIYGHSHRSVREEEPPAPGSLYGRTKLAAELICRRSGLNAVVLRYFTVYGERQRPDMAFAVFIEAALDDGVADLIAGGRHVRHFTFVGDAVEATIRALHHAPAGAVYNVAGPKPATVASTLRLIEGHLGKPVSVRHIPAYEGEALRTNADLSRAQRDLAWRPRVALAEGLRCQINYALSERGAPHARHALTPAATLVRLCVPPPAASQETLRA